MFDRYKKQVLISEIGKVGQSKLSESNVLIIGCGGLGSTVIPLLAASGIGHITLCDDDKIQMSNLNRQVIYKESDINQSKVIKAQEFVKSLNSDVNVQVLNNFVTPKNFEEVFKNVDVVVDCTDRLATKLFLNDAAVLLGKPLVHSAAIGFTGQVLTVFPYGKPCLRCFFECQYMSLHLNCSNAGILGATVGVVGSIAVAETIKYLLKIPDNLVGNLQRIDLRSNEFTKYTFQKNSACIACSDNMKVDPYDYNYYESKLCF
ncbi:moeZ/MoeB domain protein [Ehrlichia chaffeensis str. Heartland]|uniref:Adenylyltransferase thiF n=1 Tax=Ehrlichia chaffeensis (strain ATCC CRL-10679 / Arkansas) TaxID=205920 RepID=Q2GF92_EHRCR|nr:HesA/MoeB/ThiF family protein [Ehrlichia chaffeensis]ABD44656.1 adenylyltransferase thiF [Ehrlichia chaffeensis str. Arkansas]AHX03251.1 moeZ/MoeB domain protein [Ehrlichia chaffeensis str. Heartland]AHX05167.1 moeZ/MoeB domain protein [Ehrlichia chaffeensis str. Jax]AHX06156.1 moeZ/MoeB domain protein [Ehrlichia chaffeensis str. Liberty]AHX07252.1 moeZ/MoeB domain protein [Ehrlichia chaffeensis str. Osceola]